MQVEIPDNCECTDDTVCDHCIWNTACAIEDLRESMDRILKQTGQI